MFRQSVDHEDEDGPEDIGYADPRRYTRCIACLRVHGHCDRRMPTCQRCEELNEQCIYPKRRKNGTHRANSEMVGPARRSSLKPSPTGNRSSSSVHILDPKASQSLPSIAWQEGDISHSQKKCPIPIMDLMRHYREEFEGTQLSGLWALGKTVYAENGKECACVDGETNEDVSIARYTYGPKKQFFVAWLPAQDASHPSVPVICKFRVYNNEPNVSRNGRMWRPLRWRTFRPDKRAYHGREVFRLVCTSAYKAKPPAGAPEVVDLLRNAKTSYRQSRTGQTYENYLSGDDTDEQDQRHPNKRLRTDSEPSRKTPSNTHQLRGSKGTSFLETQSPPPATIGVRYQVRDKQTTW